MGFLIVIFLLSFLLVPFIGVSFFPRTDAGQFVINVKAPTGTRIEVTDDYVKRVEDIVRQVVAPRGSENDRFQHRLTCPIFLRCSRRTPECIPRLFRWA